LQDSTRVGQVNQYVLSIHYPSGTQIFFPDSSYDYRPFTFSKRHFFDTKSQQGISQDSVVYDLITLEIAEEQLLTLPVFLVLKSDSLTHSLSPKSDTLFFKELIKGDISDYQIKSDSRAQSLAYYFNYPLLIGVLLLLILFSILFWSLLGKRVRKYYQLFQFRTRQSNFEKEFTRLHQRLLRDRKPKSLEKAQVLWKKQMEFLETKPYSSYTTKDIYERSPDPALIQSLKNIDRAIYGQDLSEDISKDLRVLESFVNQIFEKKQSRLINA
ncbi:MAG: hypothetical protein AAFU64_09475, partial [Bacteroidota bacterium]